jgi:hypothetical protein
LKENLIVGSAAVCGPPIIFQRLSLSGQGFGDFEADTEISDLLCAQPSCHSEQ